MIVPLVLCLALHASGEAPLTEAQAAQRAVRASAAVRALDLRIDESRAEERAAGGLENPELRLENYRSDRGFDEGRIAIRWTPPRPGEWRALRAEAAAETAESSAERELAHRAVAARARTLHATIASLDAQHALARQELAERERASAAMQRRLEAADATVVDRSEAELDRLEAANVLEDIEVRRGEARAGLFKLLGLPGGADLALSAEGGTRCAAPPEEEVLTGAARSHPLLEALRAGERAAAAKQASDRLGLLPWPTFLEAGWVRRRGGEPEYWEFQLGVELPLFDLRSSEGQAAAARRSRLGVEARAEVEAGEAELRLALAELRAHAAAAERWRAAAAALEDAVQRHGRHAELASAPETAKLRARLLAARREGLRAELACTLDRIEVDRLSGRTGE